MSQFSIEVIVNEIQENDKFNNFQEKSSKQKEIGKIRGI